MASGATEVVPAHLDHLAIYNPSFGPGEDEFEKQVVFFYDGKLSRPVYFLADTKGSKSQNQPELELETAGCDRATLQWHLRKLGAAQATTSIVRRFNYDTVDSIETSQSRTIVFELEPDWWVTARINFTKVIRRDPTSKPGLKDKQSFVSEYFAREVPPPFFLLSQLRQGHRIFLLHHGSSLREMMESNGTEWLTCHLARYWARFASLWSVVYSGNPAVEIYDGIKLAFGGELGVGRDEEGWGSSVRDVLEGMIDLNEGLIDVLAYRFGDLPTVENGSKKPKADASEIGRWLGAGNYPALTDGLVFSGSGNITKPTVRTISQWIQSVYMFGESACAVRIVKGTRPRPPARPPTNTGPDGKPKANSRPVLHPARRLAAHVPPPIPGKETSSPVTIIQLFSSSSKDDAGPGSNDGDKGGWLQYLTLDYKLLGFGLAGNNPKSQRRLSTEERRKRAHVIRENNGFFLIGLRGSLDEEADDNDEASVSWAYYASQGPISQPIYVELSDQYLEAMKHRQEVESAHTPDNQETSEKCEEDVKDGGMGNVLPHLDSIELDRHQMLNEDAEKNTPLTAAEPESPLVSKILRARLVVYIHRPFIYVFIIDPNPQLPILRTVDFFQTVHKSLTPIHRLFENSTKVETMAEKAKVLFSATGQPPVSLSPVSSPVKSRGWSPFSLRKQPPPRSAPPPTFGLSFSPDTLFISSTIPPIPAADLHPSSGAGSGQPAIVPHPLGLPALTNWTRVEAILVHLEILEMIGQVESRRKLVMGKSPAAAAAAEGSADKISLEGDREFEKLCRNSKGWWILWSAFAPEPERLGNGERSGGREGATTNGGEYEITSVSNNPDVQPSTVSKGSKDRITTSNSSSSSAVLSTSSWQPNRTQAKFLQNPSKSSGLPSIHAPSPPTSGSSSLPVRLREAIIIRPSREKQSSGETSASVPPLPPKMFISAAAAVADTIASRSPLSALRIPSSAQKGAAGTGAAGTAPGQSIPPVPKATSPPGTHTPVQATSGAHALAQGSGTGKTFTSPPSTAASFAPGSVAMMNPSPGTTPGTRAAPVTEGSGDADDDDGSSTVTARSAKSSRPGAFLIPKRSAAPRDDAGQGTARFEQIAGDELGANRGSKLKETDADDDDAREPSTANTFSTTTPTGPSIPKPAQPSRAPSIAMQDLQSVLDRAAQSKLNPDSSTAIPSSSSTSSTAAPGSKPVTAARTSDFDADSKSKGNISTTNKFGSFTNSFSNLSFGTGSYNLADTLPSFLDFRKVSVPKLDLGLVSMGIGASGGSNNITRGPETSTDGKDGTAVEGVGASSGESGNDDTGIGCGPDRDVQGAGVVVENEGYKGKD